MKKYFAALIQSFYKPEIYRDAIIRWEGFGGRYLAILALAVALILSAGFYNVFIPFVKTEVPYVAKQLPQMVITNGVVSVTEKQPIIIQNEKKDFTIMIDTNKSLQDLRDVQSQLVVGKNFLLVRNGDNGYQSLDLNKFKGEFVLNEDTVMQLMTMIKAIAIPLFWIGQLVNLMVKLVIVTVLSYMVTAFMPEEYDFLVRMRLSILALTPAVLLTTVISIVLNHEVAPWFFMLLACLYLYVMIKAMRRLPPVQQFAV